MPVTISNIGLNYPITIPLTTETADIQVALKLLAYGISSSPSTDDDILDSSLAGALKKKAPLISPSFTTPSLGVATATSINGTPIPTNKFLLETNSALTGTNGYLLQYTATGPEWVDYSTAGTIANATKAQNLSSGVLGSVPYQSSPNTTAFIAPNTTTTKKFLSQTGTGSVGAEPVWLVISKSDVGLSNVENVALSDWTGNTSITSVGTITTGTWSAGTIVTTKGGTGLTSFTSGGALYATSTSALTTGTLPVASGGTGLTAFGTGVSTGLSTNINSGNGFVTANSTATIAASTTGNATSATNAVKFGGSSAPMNYTGNPANRIYTGSTAPTSGLNEGDIWMW